MYQQFWRPSGDDACQDIWYREMPEGLLREKKIFHFTQKTCGIMSSNTNSLTGCTSKKKRNVLAVLSEYGLKKAIIVGERYTARKIIRNIEV